MAGSTKKVLQTQETEEGRDQDAPMQETEEGRDQDALMQETEKRWDQDALKRALDALLAERDQKTSEPKHVAEPLEPEASSDEASHALNAFVQANEEIMDSMAALGAEMMEFGAKRVRENIERSESLMRCNDPVEAFRIQHEFYQSATQQYLEQSNKVLTVMAQMTGNIWAPLEESTRETLRNLNKEAG